MFLLEVLRKDIAMPRRRYFIPLKDSEFMSFQRQLVTKVQAKKADWGIPDSAVDVLVAHRTKYEPLYQKASGKNTRSSVDVGSHRRERKAYEKAIRAFVNAHVRFNDRMTNVDRLSIGVPPRDPKNSPKPRIDDIPFVGLTPIGGGWIRVFCKRETDEDSPSMHNFADVIECRYALLPVRPVRDAITGDVKTKQNSISDTLNVSNGVRPQPIEGKKFRFPSAGECPQVQISTKARFIIKCGDENAGQKFYGYFRWVNLSNPANNGSWTNGLQVVIA